MGRDHLQKIGRALDDEPAQHFRRLSDSETPLGVAMSIEPRHRDRIAAQFPANPDESGLAGNRAVILWTSFL